MFLSDLVSWLCPELKQVHSAAFLTLIQLAESGLSLSKFTDSGVSSCRVLVLGMASQIPVVIGNGFSRG